MYSIMYTEIQLILFKNQINTAITSATLFLQNNNFSFPANLLYTEYKLANNFWSLKELSKKWKPFIIQR